MKKLIVLLCLSMFISNSFAQDSSPITIANGKYYQNDIPLSVKAIKSIVIDVPDAYQEVKKGNGRNITGLVFSGLGGAILGGALSDAILGTTYYGDDPKSGILGGVLFIGTGVWLSISGAKKISTGVELYNSSFNSGYNFPGVNLDFGAAPNGIGFTLTF